jgi:glycosyltransferase involved in cell wall biosynthesis
MLNGKRIVVVMPAYNAEKTLLETYNHLPHEIVDEIVLVDDSSNDDTVSLARDLNIRTFVHKSNFGYGRNQKTCYKEALELGADIVIMVHPDYQYSPELVTSMAGMLAYGVYDAALASRILGVGALKGGMPLYKYVSNRFLTFVQNVFLGYKLSEYHTGYRAFTREVLEQVAIENNADDFSFDNEMLAQIIYFGYSIGEISCPTKYFKDASSISFSHSVTYGLKVLAVSLKFRMQRWKIMRSRIFAKDKSLLKTNIAKLHSNIDCIGK